MRTRFTASIAVTVLAVLAAGAAGGRAADRPFSLADVLSSPYPSNLVAARKADRVAWIMNDRGARNVWTAAAPDLKPVDLTGYARDEVFKIDEVQLTDDGRTAVFVSFVARTRGTIGHRYLLTRQVVRSGSLGTVATLAHPAPESQGSQPLPPAPLPASGERG